MQYSTPWRRSYAEWSFNDSGQLVPVTTRLEPWPTYLRRIARRVWWEIHDALTT